MRSALHVLIPFCKNMRTSSALTSGRRILARTWGSDLRLAYWTVMVVVGAARYAKSFLGLRSLAPRRTISRWNLFPCALPSEYPQLSNESQRGLCCCDFQRRRERISCPPDGKHATTMLFGNKAASFCSGRQFIFFHVQNRRTNKRSINSIPLKQMHAKNLF